MEQVNVIPMTQQDVATQPPLTLKKARERMIQLLSEAESNAWEIGDLLNQVEKQGLARSEGYGKTRNWLQKDVPGAAEKTSTLYRYAEVAAAYTKQHVAQWGISKLQLLIAHDRDVVGHTNPEDPANREIQLNQPDGSKVTKKFQDCNLRELRQSTQIRRSGKTPGKEGTQRSEVRSLRKSASKSADHSSPGTGERSVRLAFAMMGFGVVLSVISQLLPLGLISVWTFLAGGACFLGGIGILVRHWHDFRERLISAVKEGKALEFLKEQLDNATRGAQKIAIGIRSRMKVTKAPNRSPEETPPTEKKAA